MCNGQCISTQTPCNSSTCYEDDQSKFWPCQSQKRHYNHCIPNDMVCNSNSHFSAKRPNTQCPKPVEFSRDVCQMTGLSNQIKCYEEFGEQKCTGMIGFEFYGI